MDGWLGMFSFWLQSDVVSGATNSKAGQFWLRSLCGEKSRIENRVSKTFDVCLAVYSRGGAWARVGFRWAVFILLDSVRRLC